MGVTEGLALILAFAIAFSMFRHYREKQVCRYCGGEWRRHDVHCPWDVLNRR